jgi:hypothetical protein
LPKDKEKIARLIKLIKSGRIAVSTAWGSMHTDFMGAEELNPARLRLRDIKENIRRAIASWRRWTTFPVIRLQFRRCWPEAARNILLRAQIFLSASPRRSRPAKSRFTGNRPTEARFNVDKPEQARRLYEGLTDFYLDPYSLDPYTDKTPFDMFNPELAGKKTDLQIMEIGVTELLNRYNKAGYKYDAVMAMYAHDFVEPTDVINLERVRLNSGTQNIRNPTENCHAAGISEIHRNEIRGQIPTFRGEWSGLWSEAKTQSPKISAYRALRARPRARARNALERHFDDAQHSVSGRQRDFHLRFDVHLRRTQRRGQQRLDTTEQPPAARRTKPPVRPLYADGDWRNRFSSKPRLERHRSAVSL